MKFSRYSCNSFCVDGFADLRSIIQLFKIFFLFCNATYPFVFVNERRYKNERPIEHNATITL